MPFGTGFENLADRLGTSREPQQVRAAFVGAIGNLGGSSGLGGTLYVPRLGRTPLRIDVSSESLTIPANIELRIAPGVLLAPVAASSGGPSRSSGTLEIEGALRARIGPIFLTPARFAALDPEGARGHNLGRVRFTGRAMERVHPEWWGAGQGGDDSDALEEAVRAALLDRWNSPRSGERRALRPLVIELRGSYGLSRPLAISGSGRVADASAGVELRAAPGGIEAPTFWCHERFPAGQPMVAVSGFEGVTLDEVRFDGGGRAGQCLHVLLPASDEAAKGASLHRCEFRGATTELARIASEGTAPVSDLRAALSRQEVHVEGCRFMPGANEVTAPVALRLMGTPTMDVDVHGSLFEGEAAAMIHASSCALSVESSQFRNDLMPSRDGEVPDFDDLHRDGPEGGVDIFLDAFVRDPSAALAEFGPPASLQAQDCRSKSVQFLATCRSAAPDSGRDTTVVALHHARRVTGPLLTWTGRRAPPIPDFIPPDPVIVTPQEPFEKRSIPVGVKVDPSLAKQPAITPTKGAPNRIVAPAKAAPPGTVFDVSRLGVAALSRANPTEPPTDGFTSVARTIDVGGRPLPSAIDWRIPSSSGARLVLIGCRFDWNGALGRSPVRGFSGTVIADIGAFHGRGSGTPVIESNGAVTTVPTLASIDT